MANVREEDAVHLNNSKCNWNTKCSGKSLSNFRKSLQVSIVTRKKDDLIITRKMHDEYLTVMLKSRKRKFSLEENKSNQSLASAAVGSRTISRSKKLHGESNDNERSLFGECSTVIDANNSNDIACDIVELSCESSDNSNEGTTYSQISTELEEDEICTTCKDCVECQLEQQNSAAKIRKTKGGLMSGQDEEHLSDESDVSSVETTSTSSTILIEHEEAPILVDLTNEGSKQTWKQTILKFSDAEESLKMSGEKRDNEQKRCILPKYHHL